MKGQSADLRNYLYHNSQAYTLTPFKAPTLLSNWPQLRTQPSQNFALMQLRPVPELQLFLPQLIPAAGVTAF